MITTPTHTRYQTGKNIPLQVLPRLNLQKSNPINFSGDSVILSKEELNTIETSLSSLDRRIEGYREQFETTYNQLKQELFNVKSRLQNATLSSEYQLAGIEGIFDDDCPINDKYTNAREQLQQMLSSEDLGLSEEQKAYMLKYRSFEPYLEAINTIFTAPKESDILSDEDILTHPLLAKERLKLVQDVTDKMKSIERGSIYFIWSSSCLDILKGSEENTIDYMKKYRLYSSEKTQNVVGEAITPKVTPLAKKVLKIVLNDASEEYRSKNPLEKQAYIDSLTPHQANSILIKYFQSKDTSLWKSPIMQEVQEAIHANAIENVLKDEEWKTQLIEECTIGHLQETVEISVNKMHDQVEKAIKKENRSGLLKFLSGG